MCTPMGQSREGSENSIYVTNHRPLTWAHIPVYVHFTRERLGKLHAERILGKFRGSKIEKWPELRVECRARSNSCKYRIYGDF